MSGRIYPQILLMSPKEIVDFMSLIKSELKFHGVTVEKVNLEEMWYPKHVIFTNEKNGITETVSIRHFIDKDIDDAIFVILSYLRPVVDDDFVIE